MIPQYFIFFIGIFASMWYLLWFLVQHECNLTIFKIKNVALKAEHCPKNRKCCCCSSCRWRQISQQLSMVLKDAYLNVRCLLYIHTHVHTQTRTIRTTFINTVFSSPQYHGCRATRPESNLMQGDTWTPWHSTAGVCVCVCMCTLVPGCVRGP